MSTRPREQDCRPRSIHPLKPIKYAYKKKQKSIGTSIESSTVDVAASPQGVLGGEWGGPNTQAQNFNGRANFYTVYN
jgi:hypothetical protein